MSPLVQRAAPNYFSSSSFAIPFNKINSIQVSVTMKNNSRKTPSTPSTFKENTSVTFNSLSTLSYHRIVHRATPRTTNEPSFVIVNSLDNDPLTRSILIDTAVQQRGFLPNDYRLMNTFEMIRRQRADPKLPWKLPDLPPRGKIVSSTRSDAFGNLTNRMSRLAEQRLVLHERKTRRTPTGSTSISPKLEKNSHEMSDADFATDIPNALELMLKDSKKKTLVERHLFENMRRERLQQARYRLLPINRAPHG